MLYVTTKNAVYAVDREGNRWMRSSTTHPKDTDRQWIDGGFTVGQIGELSFAHYADDPRGALGRWTTATFSVSEEVD